MSSPPSASAGCMWRRSWHGLPPKSPICALFSALVKIPVGALRDGPWDVLVHVGRLPDLRITQRRLAPNQRFLVASPGYVARHDALRDPSALVRHRIGVVRENRADASLLSLSGPDGTETTLRIHPVFACNDGEVLRKWALDGFGIVERSEWPGADGHGRECVGRE